MKRIITALGVLALASTLSLADDQPATTPATTTTTPSTPAAKPKHERDPEKMFKKLDANGDGFITLEEFKASPAGERNPEHAEKTFKKMDTKGDGKVTLEEFKAYYEAHPGKSRTRRLGLRQQRLPLRRSNHHTAGGQVPAERYQMLMSGRLIRACTHCL